jgi:predicted amidohydrolase
VRLALAQTDVSLGQVASNAEHASDTVAKAASHGADLVVFPELFMNGYALGQLKTDQSLTADDERLTALSSMGPDVLLGFHEDGGVRTYNSAAYLANGHLLHLHRKLYLPNYLVWEERKHASPGQEMRAFNTSWGRAAVLICNDAWQPVLPWLAAQDGAEILFIPTNSAAAFGPESLDTIEYWGQLLQLIARMQQCWVIFVNRVGTEAGARYWGGSRVIDPSGKVVVQAPLWEPALTVVDIDVSAAHRRRREVPLVAEARLGLVEREVRRLIAEGGDA